MDRAPDAGSPKRRRPPPPRVSLQIHSCHERCKPVASAQRMRAAELETPRNRSAGVRVRRGVFLASWSLQSGGHHGHLERTIR